MSSDYRKTYFFVPQTITAEIQLSPEVLQQVIEHWCADKPGSSFKHAAGGVMVETSPENMTLDIELPIPAQTVRMAVEYGKWCLAPPVIEVSDG